MARQLTRNKKTTSDKVKFNFDVAMLNMLVKYTQCEYVARSDLYRLKKLFTYTDISLYQTEVPIAMRVNVLMVLLDAMVEVGLSSPELIRRYMQQNFEPGVEILNDIGLKQNMVPVSECEYIRKFVNEKLQHIEIYQHRDKLITLLRKIDDTADFNTSYYDTIAEIKNTIGTLMVSLQDTNQVQGILREFSFSNPDAASTLAQMIYRAKRPTSTLQSGIRQLNATLSGGFQGGRLYTILGGSGKFKSGTLLNIADQIRRFNPQIVPYEGGMRKCILFVTLENSIEETVERIYDMYTGMDADFRSMSTDEIINSLKEDAGFSFQGGAGGIDIAFRYAGNLEISTADIYAMVSDLNNKGLQPIAIVVDYIKRIDSAHNSNGDERIRMSFVAKELKTIAQFYDIPVITAMQLNRAGNDIIDAAMRDGKQDLARFVGSASIGNAWDIIEDSDWVCLINLELQKSTNQLFLTFKRLKIRGKKVPMASDYFNHPFVNAKNIRLEPDVDKPEPISIISLATDLESIIEDTPKSKSPQKNLQKVNREKRTATSILGSLTGTIASADALMSA